MDLDEESEAYSTSSAISIFHKKYINGVRYVGIFCKGVNNPRRKRCSNHASQDKEDGDENFQYTKEKDDNSYYINNLTSF